MPCPTCDHTMEGVRNFDGWQCPRCGTLVTRNGPVFVPTLVERAAALAADGDVSELAAKDSRVFQLRENVREAVEK